MQASVVRSDTLLLPSMLRARLLDSMLMLTSAGLWNDARPDLAASMCQLLCPSEAPTAALTLAVQEDEDGHIVLQVVRLKTNNIHCHCPKLVLAPAGTHMLL